MLDAVRQLRDMGAVVVDLGGVHVEFGYAPLAPKAQAVELPDWLKEKPVEEGDEKANLDLQYWSAQ